VHKLQAQENVDTTVDPKVQAPKKKNTKVQASKKACKAQGSNK
jgi:hypothetical protein